MITFLFIALTILWVFFLSVTVIRLRGKEQVAFGAGESPALEAAIRAHGNTTEYAPLFLLGLYILETHGGSLLFILVTGAVFLIGRLIHACGLMKRQIRLRVVGMQMTFWPLIAVALYLLMLFFI